MKRIDDEFEDDFSEDYRYEDNDFSPRRRSKKTKGHIWGVVLVTLGLLLIANNLGIIPFFIKQLIFRWEMILIGIGVINLFRPQKKHIGYILITIGVFFMLPDFFGFPVSFRRNFWPVIFVVIGGIILFRRNKLRGSNFENDNQLDEVAIFGGGKRKIMTQDFRGGSVISIFGGAEIDLTESTLADGNNAIEMLSIFGGTKLIVPVEWNVKIEVVSIFAGFNDKRSDRPDYRYDQQKVLYIRGFVLFAGGEIRSGYKRNDYA